MEKLRIISFVLLVIGLNSALGIETSSKKFSIPAHGMKFIRGIDVDGSYYYILYDFVNDSIADIVINAGKISNYFENGPESACNITLKAREGYIFDQVRLPKIYPFGEDGAIISAVEEDWHSRLTRYYSNTTEDNVFTVLRVVNFTNCQVSDPKFHFHFFPSINVHEDTFEVIYNNKSVCGDKFCRAVFDSQGNLLNGPINSIAYNAGITRISTIQAHPNSESQIAVVKSFEGRNDGIMLITNGQIVELATKPVRIVSPIATNHQTLGIIEYDTIDTISDTEPYLKNMRVLQFDLKGNLKLNVTLDVDRRIDIGASKIQNLADGGFIFVSVRSLDESCGEDTACVNVARYDSNGKVEGKAIKNLKVNYSNVQILPSSLYETRLGEHCLVWEEIEKVNDKMERSTLRNCFSKKDFE